MKGLKYFIIGAIFLPLASFAQQSAHFTFNWKVAGEQRQVYALNQPNALLVNKTGGAFGSIIAIKEIKYSLPKGAIFCRMEDALHQHFNFWFKVRMGCDDRYSN